MIEVGVANATRSVRTEWTFFTDQHQLIGKPEYMIPQRAEGSLDSDTRRDVHSLRVLLYELLKASTPFSGWELRSAA